IRVASFSITMKISLLLLALVAGLAANVDADKRNGDIQELTDVDQDSEDFLLEEDDDEEEDDFDDDDEEEEQSSLVRSLPFLEGRNGVCAGKAKGSCKKQGGECVTAPFADNCKAIHGDAGKLKKQSCSGKDCQCCVPPPTCSGKIKKPCSKNGGHCVLKPFKSNCKGGTLDKKTCKSKHCQCCIPPPTTAPPPTTLPQASSTLILCRRGRCFFTTTKSPQPTTTPPPPPTTTPPPPPTTIPPPPPTTIPPPPPTTTPPPPPTTTPPPPPTTTPPPPPTTTPPPPPTTTPPPPPTTTPLLSCRKGRCIPITTPPPTTTPPPQPTTTPQPPPTTTAPPAPTTTPAPPPTTTPPPPPTTTPPPPPTTTPPPPPTTTPPPPPTTTPPPPPTTTPPPPPTTTPPPLPTTTPPPPPTTLPPAPTTEAVPENRLLPSIRIRSEHLEWKQGFWGTKKQQDYNLVMARGPGQEEQFVYIQNNYPQDGLINVCDLQYGTYESNGRKGVFFVYHDKDQKPYQKRFSLNANGIDQEILDAINEDINSSTFPGTSTSSSFWSFSWLFGDYLKDVDC
ncbi:unnamed protein product, partial [Meganyctiphanes norvegica]